MTDFQPTEFANRGFADQLNIETPEQVELRFPVAGIGSRFVALLIDHLIHAIAVALFWFGMYLLASSGAAAHAGKTTTADGEMTTAVKWVLAILAFLHFALIWGYFTLFEAYWKGQTPGKRIMKLRVMKDAGRQITLFESMARNLLRFVDFLPNFYLVGVIAMLCNKRNKRLGDMAAGTIVVHETPVDDRSADVFLSGGNFFAKPEHVYDERMPADAVARLDASDLHVIETFFARALDLDTATRTTMAQRIAARIAAKMQVAVPDGNPERMLEDVAKAMRSAGRRF